MLCLHAQHLCTIFKILYVWQYFIVHCHMLLHHCVHGRWHVLSSHLLQTFRFVTVKFKTMFLYFLYLQISSWPYYQDLMACYMLIATCWLLHAIATLVATCWYIAASTYVHGNQVTEAKMNVHIRLSNFCTACASIPYKVDFFIFSYSQ